jgi:hypothetical protein
MKRLMRTMTCCIATGLTLLAGFATHACSIDPYKGPFSCKNNQPCPDSQVCSDAGLCVDKTGTVVVMPDAGGGEAGTPTGSDSGTDSGEAGGCSETCSGELPYCLDGQCVACRPRDAMCEGDRPKTCDDQHRWQLQEPCEVACSSGVCTNYRLTGGISTVSDAVLSAEGLRLVDHGLSTLPSVCREVDGTTLCLTGGLYH